MECVCSVGGGRKMSVVWTTAMADAVRAVPMNERLGWDIDDAEWQAECQLAGTTGKGDGQRWIEAAGWRGSGAGLLARNRVLLG
jgi:hypothetical protein